MGVVLCPTVNGHSASKAGAGRKRDALTVAFPYNMSRAYDPGGQGPAWVTMAFTEVAPFVVRCEFIRVGDENEQLYWWCSAGPFLTESSPLAEPTKITVALDKALQENLRSYRKIAALLIDARFEAANDERRAMLAANGREKRQRLTDEYLLDLLQSNAERKACGEPMARFAADRNLSPQQVYKELVIARERFTKRDTERDTE
jgi:hypothetical protein